ncbi:ArsR/SmtB family transcription factor [Corynebacterium doosanense]|uniref:ArsR family transcriptional regulator n=1 Tax=Corynebacterium doosanense CAU 212 = DSM 45436 TaxID=558173 RepID=A0A097IHS9_9CORY|nr:metalloregulator ArsR/SmtB family transcription factor [Corynebacterium doosanense]AIT61683.1 ArsR family transcriptional regulator [Corynebacterium doosanense CAU 212 = DSM 45436]
MADDSTLPFEDWAGTFKILGDPSRLRLLTAIHASGQYVSSVTELAEASGLRVATASAALRAMERNQTVGSRRDGRNIHYAIVDTHVHELLHWMGSGHGH